VSWNEAHCVAQGEETPLDRVDQLAMVSARKIRASDRAAKEDVADLGELRLGVDEDDMAWRVPGAVDHVEPAFSDLQCLAVFQPAAGHEGLGWGKAEQFALAGYGLEQEGVLGVRADDGGPDPLGDDGGGADMIEMPVGQQDLLGLQIQRADSVQDAVGLATWVDDGGAPRLFAPEQGAVLLKGSDGEDAEFHWLERSWCGLIAVRGILRASGTSACSGDLTQGEGPLGRASAKIARSLGWLLQPFNMT